MVDEGEEERIRFGNGISLGETERDRRGRAVCVQCSRRIAIVVRFTFTGFSKLDHRAIGIINVLLGAGQR